MLMTTWCPYYTWPLVRRTARESRAEREAAGLRTAKRKVVELSAAKLSLKLVMRKERFCSFLAWRTAVALWTKRDFFISI